MHEFGLLGAGGMAGVYADRIASMEDATVTAVASPNSAEAFVNERIPEAVPYTSAERLCTEAAVDAVAVLTPTDTHPELIEVAARAGLDVICEKPLARTLEGANRIADVVHTTGITLMTAHVVRFFPEYSEAKAQVEAGAIGTPVTVRARRGFGFPGARGWFDDPNRSGGALLDVAIHDFDYLRWLLGPIERVFTRRTAWEVKGRSEVALTTLRSEQGAIAHVEVFTVDVPSIPFTTSFQITGEDGQLAFDLDEVEPIRHFTEESVQVPRDPVGDRLPLERDGYRRQLEAFCTALTEGNPPPIDLEEGIRSLRVGLAAIESAERGEPVDPGEVQP